ncbi:hypothetical protein LTR53_009934 [Teratosphaeriaceae sp. CCFEE 6253]|nr:hypothetical protein LTR53_009934 [Teratosphaeriaceae sp. CCFEE 6253]
MLNHTIPWYLFIRACIFFLHFVGPLSAAYTSTVLIHAITSRQWPLLSLLNIWTVSETTFFLFFFWYRIYLQREALHPPLRSREERRALFDKVRGEVGDIEKFLSGWFRGAKVDDVGRQEMKAWLDWAFFDGRFSAEKDGEEMEELVQEVERMVGRPFKEGEGRAKSLRLTLDPIEMQWRSLLWYGCMLVVDTITHARMLRYGMQYHSSVATTWKVFPPRPLAAVSSTAKSPAEGLSYWMRPHTSKTRLPTLFIHGIGVGLYPYVEWFHEMDLALNGDHADPDDTVGLLALEILPTSSRLTSPILTRTEFLRQITAILSHHNIDRFVLASHSYGSVLSTHILTWPALAHRVAGTLLIDPVTVLLHMPDVAFNFTVRQPTTANEWQLWYFASKDLGVAHTLGRHFFWSENVLWRDRIMELVGQGMRITASLSGRDLIVDTEAVGQYLVGGEVPDPKIVEGNGVKRMELEIDEKARDVQIWKGRTWKGRGLEVLWWDDLDHAQVFDDQKKRARLVEVLVEYSNGV